MLLATYNTIVKIIFHYLHLTILNSLHFYQNISDFFLFKPLAIINRYNHNIKLSFNSNFNLLFCVDND